MKNFIFNNIIKPIAKAIGIKLGIFTAVLIFYHISRFGLNIMFPKHSKMRLYLYRIFKVIYIVSSVFFGYYDLQSHLNDSDSDTSMKDADSDNNSSDDNSSEASSNDDVFDNDPSTNDENPPHNNDASSDVGVTEEVVEEPVDEEELNRSAMARAECMYPDDLVEFHKNRRDQDDLASSIEDKISSEDALEFLRQNNPGTHYGCQSEEDWDRITRLKMDKDLSEENIQHLSGRDDVDVVVSEYVENLDQDENMSREQAADKTRNNSGTSESANDNSINNTEDNNSANTEDKNSTNTGDNNSNE